jgi:hypothetical protein
VRRCRKALRRKDTEDQVTTFRPGAFTHFPKRHPNLCAMMNVFERGSKQILIMADQSPSTELRKLVNGYQVSQAIHVVATLGIADRLTDGPRSAEELESDSA